MSGVGPEGAVDRADAAGAADAGAPALRRVRVLFNPRSGPHFSFERLCRALSPTWDVPGIDLVYQPSLSADDGAEKARRAVADGVDTLLVAGGDGMVNSIGAAVVGSPVAFGVIPAGSANGFARHFGIPLDWEEAAACLATARRQAIDVGVANGRPFFVTCSMAWEAALVRAFERSPVRGVLPYLFSGAAGFLDYTHQPFRVEIDGEPEAVYEDPTVFTVANLTQYGAGARIAPSAREDDGRLELVVIGRRDVPSVVARLARLFDGTIEGLREVQFRAFRALTVRRERAAPIQMDGELLLPVKEIRITLKAKALRVLVPR